MCVTQASRSGGGGCHFEGFSPWLLLLAVISASFGPRDSAAFSFAREGTGGGLRSLSCPPLSEPVAQGLPGPASLLRRRRLSSSSSSSSSFRRHHLPTPGGSGAPSLGYGDQAAGAEQRQSRRTGHREQRSGDGGAWRLLGGLILTWLLPVLLAAPPPPPPLLRPRPPAAGSEPAHATVFGPVWSLLPPEPPAEAEREALYFRRGGWRGACACLFVSQTNDTLAEPPLKGKGGLWQYCSFIWGVVGGCPQILFFSPKLT